MSESGLIQHWKRIHWPKIEKCKDAHQQTRMEAKSSEPKKLSLKDLQGSFFVLSIGSILALILFVVELLVYYYTVRKNYYQPIFCLQLPSINLSKS